jgi:hypothetical protein
MTMRVAIILAVLIPTAPALAASWTDHTSCAILNAVMDATAPPMVDVRASLLYISNTFETMDSRHTEAGEPGIMAGLSDNGLRDLAAAVAVHCGNFPRLTVYNAAAFVYRGTRDLMIDLGTAK